MTSVATALRRPKVVAGVAVALLASFAIVSAVLRAQDPTTPINSGPLRANLYLNTTGFSADPGEIVTFGGHMVINAGATEAVLESAELIGSRSDNVTVDKAAVVLVIGGLPTVGAVRGYPSTHISKDRVRQIKDMKVPANGGQAELLFGIIPRKPGRYAWDGVRVHYRVGDKRYTMTDDDRFILCSPRTKEFCK